MLDASKAPRRRPKPTPQLKRRRVPQSPREALKRSDRAPTSPWSASKGGAAESVSFEDRTEMEEARRVEQPRIPSDRADTEIERAEQPWEEVIDASRGPSRARWSGDRPTQPTSVPLTEKKQPSPAAAPRRKPLPASPSLDADTDEGVVQVPVDRAPPAEKKVTPHDLPTFGIDVESWPSGNTKPVTPAYRPQEDPTSGLLENKPVTGARPRAAPPDDMPPNEETRLGAMISSNAAHETMAAPGELAGLVNDGPSRPELVDDLLSNLPPKTATPTSREESWGDEEPIEQTRPVDELIRDRELRRAQMRHPAETTSPESLRDLRIPDGTTAPEQVPDRGPPLEETRAFVETPLGGGRPDSVMVPLVGSEDTSDLPSADVLPRGPTAGKNKLELASGLRRTLALVIDGLVVLAIVTVPLLLGLFGEGPATANWLEPDDVGSMLVQGDLTIPLICLTVLVLVFSALSHGLTGRSLGKLICGLSVVRKKTGAQIGMGRAVARAFLTLLSLGLGGAGYLWLIVDRRARTWHDYLTGTVVVRT